MLVVLVVVTHVCVLVHARVLGESSLPPPVPLPRHREVKLHPVARHRVRLQRSLDNLLLSGCRHGSRNGKSF